ARIADADAALEFHSQQIVEGFELARLVLVGIAPQAHRLVGDEVVDKAPGVIDVDVPAPPVFGVAHFGQNQKRLHRLQNIFRQEPGDDGFRAADVQVEILRAALGFAHHALDNRAAARRHELGGDAVAPAEGDLHGFAQFRARRNRRDDFAFLPGGFDDPVPVGRLAWARASAELTATTTVIIGPISPLGPMCFFSLTYLNILSASCMAGLRNFATTSSELFSSSSNFSGVKTSLAAGWPNSFVHLVSTSKRRVGWPRALVTAVWPSFASSQ